MKSLMAGLLAAAVLIGCRGGDERGGSYDTQAPTVDGRRDESHGEPGTGGAGTVNDPQQAGKEDPGEGPKEDLGEEPAEEPAEDKVPRQK